MYRFCFIAEVILATPAIAKTPATLFNEPTSKATEPSVSHKQPAAVHCVTNSRRFCFASRHSRLTLLKAILMRICHPRTRRLQQIICKWKRPQGQPSRMPAPWRQRRPLTSRMVGLTYVLRLARNQSTTMNNFFYHALIDNLR